MKTFKVIDILGDFNLLIDKEIKAQTLEEGKKLVLEEVKNNIEKYMWAVIEENK